MRLAKALDREDWLTDERFALRETRKIHANELATEIEVELAKNTALEWESILQSAGVPSARLRSLPEALASAQIKERGFVQTTNDGVEVPTLPFRLGGVTAYTPKTPAPTLGQHTKEIEEFLKL